ncbi:MAG: 3-dehydroquinate synthase [Nitrospinae bacterium]|nr:3-dehydroquinate synthase [Nitrospinota bacterium]
MEVVNVGLGERSYSIYIDRGLLLECGNKLPSLFSPPYKGGVSGGVGRKAVIITNPLIRGLYGNLLENSLKEEGFKVHFIEIPDGEGYKTLETAVKIYDRLIAIKMERESPLIALGGGVIGDITGFVAATYLRGVPYIQAPTTLLAQVDSSIGGKTAVNHPKGKNLIGAFYQPKAVFIDIETLNTLPKEEILCGAAEIIKYGIIRDGDFFEFLENNIERLINLNEDVLIYSIKRSCEIKADVVSKDEKESGLRAILNFGHTIGHALESLTGYKKYRHGEAVAIGMVYAARLSLKLGLCSSEDYKRVVNLITIAGLPTEIPPHPPLRPPLPLLQKEGIKGRSKGGRGGFVDAIINSLYLDKKVKEEKIRFVLMKGIGSVELRSDISNELIRKVLTH